MCDGQGRTSRPATNKPKNVAREHLFTKGVYRRAAQGGGLAAIANYCRIGKADVSTRTILVKVVFTRDRLLQQQAIQFEY